MLLTEFTDERWVTERGDGNSDRNKIKMDYLKKEIKDLQMDLEDVETTLQINK